MPQTERCRWCNASYSTDQLGLPTGYCSKACQQADKNKLSQGQGGFVTDLQNTVQIAQLQQQRELAEQQNALIAEQNNRLAEIQAAEESERYRQQMIANREATLKQLLFDVNEMLDDLEAVGDNVSVLAQCETFTDTVHGNKFQLTDLGQIDDKRYFKNTTKRIEQIQSSSSEQALTNYKRFKALHARYLKSFACRDTFPEAESPEYQPKQKQSVFPVSKPERVHPTEEELSALVSPSEELEKLRVWKVTYIILMVFFGFGNLFLPLLSAIPAVCVYYFLFKPNKERLSPLEGRFQAALAEAKQKHLAQLKATHRQAAEQWQKDKQDFEASLPEVNKAIDEHNARLKERREAAQREWTTKKQDAINRINNYMDRHPHLENWFQRVNGDSEQERAVFAEQIAQTTQQQLLNGVFSQDHTDHPQS